MLLGDILIAQHLVKREEVERARERQRVHGGTLGQNLTALGGAAAGWGSAATEAAGTEAAGDWTPAMPRSLAETGLEVGFLITLAIKTMYVAGVETPSRLAEELRLPQTVTAALVDHARERGLLEAAGAVERSLTGEVRFQLSAKGREWAATALGQSQYVGPAPVPLAHYQRQIERQRLTSERVDPGMLAASLGHLVLPEELRDELGPAMNYGTALLLYGPPGNGKTSIAIALADLFRQRIYVPYALEIDGQVIQVFDPTVHVRADDEEAGGAERPSVRLVAGQADRRWVACRRPVVITGGELTLEMLELQVNPVAKFYEAPLQLKAANGLFVLDDFGRQRVQPMAMLNRWLLPLEHRIDYLALQTGKKFPIPFDVLVIFSTNIPPKQLMDDAMLRRIPYKVLLDAPAEPEYREIFHRVAAAAGVEGTDEALATLFAEVYRGGDGDGGTTEGSIGLARFHPRFIVEHVVAACRYAGIAPRLDRELTLRAAQHLFTRE